MMPPFGEICARICLHLLVILIYCHSWGGLLLVATRKPMVNPLYTIFMSLILPECIHLGLEVACVPLDGCTGLLDHTRWLTVIATVVFMIYALVAPVLVIVVMCSLTTGKGDEKRPCVANKRAIFGLVVGILVVPPLVWYWPCYPKPPRTDSIDTDPWRRCFFGQPSAKPSNGSFYCISSCSDVSTACLAWSIYVIAGVSVIYVLIWIAHKLRRKLVSIVRLAERSYEKLASTTKEPIPTAAGRPPSPSPMCPLREDHDGVGTRSQRLSQFAKIATWLLAYSAVFAVVILERRAIGDRMWIATVVHTFFMSMVVPVLWSCVECNLDDEFKDFKEFQEAKKKKMATKKKEPESCMVDTSTEVATMGSIGRSPDVPMASLMKRLAEKNIESDDDDTDDEDLTELFP